jgi:2-polyprenyl-3-methyl-5-hydroxy-6-metoxy-1,4-benzoquinol methylase
MNTEKSTQDKAGQRYWDRSWQTGALPPRWDVGARGVRFHVRRAFLSHLARTFERHGLIGSDKSVIEVGCARSVILPQLAKVLKMRVAGLDYSPNGCEQARAILSREGVLGDIYCCDFFSIPEDLAERFDVIVSFGLIEHFTDTTAAVRALSRLLKPGGMMFTSVPNLCGAIGFVQRVLDRATYDIHNPLNAVELRSAHRDAGLEVIECGHFLSTNFGVLNLNAIPPLGIEWMSKKLVMTMLTGLSVAIWCIEDLVGDLPAGPTFSPYVNCLAVK